MARIAGLARFDDPRPSQDATLAGAMLRRYGRQPQTVTTSTGGLALSAANNRASIGSFAGVEVMIDGCILNAAELRAALHEPNADDAAIVAALYRKHGMVGAMAHLSGDFAVALHDANARRLWLARDRFGVKPLYWAQVKGGFAFASQPGPLLSLPEVSTDLDRSFVARFAASHYRTFDNDPACSPYAAVMQVPAGSAIEFAAGRAPTHHAYWTLHNEGDARTSERELAEAYRAELIRAVKDRLSGAAKPIFTLSGGLDSSSVLCSAAHVTGAPQVAISSVYADAIYDERNEIQDVVKEKVSKWHAIEIGNAIDVQAIVARQVRLHDEPVATATWLSHLLLGEHVARNGHDVVFGGLGGDELNAGEYEYFPMHFADLRAAGDTAALDHEIACWARHHDHPIHRKDKAVAAELMARLTDPAAPGHVKPDMARMLHYRNALAPGFFNLDAFAPNMDAPFPSYLKNRAFQDMFRETLPCCLRAQDRHSEAFGVATINPFLDHQLVELMFRVPGTMKIRDGITKRLLREAIVGIVPEATRTRVKKTGWNAPAHVWFGGRVLDELRDRVNSARFRERGVYDPAVVMRLIEDHVRIVESGADEANHMMFLWQLLNLESWLDALPDITGKPGTTGF